MNPVNQKSQDAFSRTVANISWGKEGFERGSNKDFVKFLFIAKGSAGEVRSILYVASDLKYIQHGDFETINGLCIECSRLIWALIKNLREKPDWIRGMTP
jgi:four helix bundle protein